MNLAILHPEVQNFINTNLKTDITKLILKGCPFENVTIQEIAEQIVSKNKCETKLPTWFGTKYIYYPNKLNIEQTSSEIAANFKSSLISGNSIIDLTGGFGIDTFYFSKKFKEVTHCELNENLSKIVSHNIKQLKKTNIFTFTGDGLQFLLNSDKIYDCVYVDPSRRNDIKGKVFLLEDCLPNIPLHIDVLFSKTETILMKTSPVLDITSAINELKHVEQVYVVAIDNEVKELLFLLKKNFNGIININAINILKIKTDYFKFNFNEINPATFGNPQQYLYEPNSAILKAGAFAEISFQYKVEKLHGNSHLYSSNDLIDFPGRRFIINQCIPYNIKTLKKLFPSKKANISIRNFPETVETIRKKTGLKDGGDNYLFFTTNYSNEYIVLLCSKI